MRLRTLLCSFSHRSVLQLCVARNASRRAGRVAANVTFIDDAVVHRLSVNPKVRLLCCLVVTLRAGKLHTLVLVELVNLERCFVSTTEMTYVACKQGTLQVDILVVGLQSFPC